MELVKFIIGLVDETQPLWAPPWVARRKERERLERAEKEFQKGRAYYSSGAEKKTPDAQGMGSMDAQAIEIATNINWS
jgi:hypothetical protein